MSSSKIQNVTDETFASIVEQSERPVMFVISAPWCIDCRRVAPLFERMADTYGDKMLFAYCDFDDNKKTVEALGVRHIPTFFVYKNGEIVDTLVEPKSIAPFKEFVEKHIA